MATKRRKKPPPRGTTSRRRRRETRPKTSRRPFSSGRKRRTDSSSVSRLLFFIPFVSSGSRSVEIIIIDRAFLLLNRVVQTFRGVRRPVVSRRPTRARPSSRHRRQRVSSFVFLCRTPSIEGIDITRAHVCVCVWLLVSLGRTTAAPLFDLFFCGVHQNREKRRSKNNNTPFDSREKKSDDSPTFDEQTRR